MKFWHQILVMALVHNEDVNMENHLMSIIGGGHVTIWAVLFSEDMNQDI